jgi:YjjG family noncanonical pyrimidine nucleotidase
LKTTKKYRHIFFDLDHTLWDFERNANECLIEIYEKYGLEKLIFEQNILKEKNDNTLNINSLEEFLLSFDVVNHELWRLLDKRQITHIELRERRFKETLAALNVEIEVVLSDQLNNEFLQLLPTKSHLIDGAVEILEYLLPKYELHIITNGFDEIQASKMQSSEIFHYFGEVITNERANARKPEKEIFDYAIKLTNATFQESIMIGDNYEADILGGISAGIDTVFYNPSGEGITHKNPTYEIDNLLELKKIL